MSYLLGIPAILLMFALGIVQMGIGASGIEHHLGGWAAGGAVFLALFARIMLPLTIGSYFGAVDVLGWPWWGGVLVALPGIVFVIPVVVFKMTNSLMDLFLKEK